MHNPEFFPPKKKQAAFSEWSPNIHYAQSQKLPPCKLPKRRIYDFELLYVQQGEAATILDGKHYSLSAGQMIFIPAGIYHQNEVVSSPFAQFIGIHFDFFGDLDIQTEADIVVNESAVQFDKFGVEAIAESFAPLSMNPLYTPSLSCVQLMKQLVHEFTMRPLGYTLICKALLLNILGLLLRTQTEYNPAHFPMHGDRILELMVLIEEKPAEMWTNQKLAKHLNMNDDHMSKIFKRIAGMPPGEYVQMIRLRKARLLLRETNLSIEEVGREIGYADIHYFSRLFRKYEGISPSKYRNLSRIL
ncbi:MULTISPECIES: helix-turn-helix transcriptional regulator [Bacillaceae]|uniref:AraC-like DNA-binding protein n=1 Tax=Peribacillus huizhouensis TaxID=1501239 RepID=A0ABR6CNP7_9BACI|nr:MULTISPECIES: AraC family transcriptional regulator [Bacillaceae]MBA9026669.1 AraC-like DNA-binding protein [Peribacillus huizhouensis]